MTKIATVTLMSISSVTQERDSGSAFVGLWAMLIGLVGQSSHIRISFY